MIRKTSPTTFAVPDYIAEIFSAAHAANLQAENYARVAADAYSRAWTAIEQIHPQKEGHYYSYSLGKIQRHKRPAPDLVQK